MNGGVFEQYSPHVSFAPWVTLCYNQCYEILVAPIENRFGGVDSGVVFSVQHLVGT